MLEEGCSVEKLHVWQVSEELIMEEGRENVLEASFLCSKIDRGFVAITGYLSDSTRVCCKRQSQERQLLYPSLECGFENFQRLCDRGTTWEPTTQGKHAKPVRANPDQPA